MASTRHYGSYMDPFFSFSLSGLNFYRIAIILQSLLEKGWLTNERKMKLDEFLKESALPYLWWKQ